MATSTIENIKPDLFDKCRVFLVKDHCHLCGQKFRLRDTLWSLDCVEDYSLVRGNSEEKMDFTIHCHYDCMNQEVQH